MFDPKTVSLGIAPIGWCNDDMPELGAENTFQQTVSEMALAGFTGCEIGNKYPTDPAELKKALDLRGMRIASRWYSSCIVAASLIASTVITPLAHRQRVHPATPSEHHRHKRRKQAHSHVLPSFHFSFSFASRSMRAKLNLLPQLIHIA